MKIQAIRLLALGALIPAGACKRKASPTNDAPIAAAIPQPSAVGPARVQPSSMTPSQSVAQAPIDPEWPSWLPPIRGVRRRFGHGDMFAGNATGGVLVTLVAARQAFEQRGFTLSQTSVRRQPWEERFIFTATRGGDFSRVELVEATARPGSVELSATNANLARTMMRRAR